METKSKVIGNTKYKYCFEESPVEFICARCGRRKVAKKYAKPYKGDVVTENMICNGCFGALSVKAEK